MAKNAPRLRPGGDSPLNGTVVSSLLHYKVVLGASDTTVRIYDSSGTESSEGAPHGLEVVDAYVVMNGAGAASDAVKITDGTSDITDDLDVSAAGDTDRVAFGEIDDANATIAKGGQLYVVSTSGALCDVHILARAT